MQIFKNKDLIIEQVNNDYYCVANPLIKNGIRLINTYQYNVLSKIYNGISIEELSKITGYEKTQLSDFCHLLNIQDILNFDNNFKSVEDLTIKLSSLNLWIHTTNDCCLRCSYCNIHTLGNQMYMGDAEISQLCKKVKETVKYNSLGLVVLRLSGGEPLLQWKVWRNILNNLKHELSALNCKLRVTILTNLVLLNDDILRWIIEDEIAVSVSLDGIKLYQDISRHFANGKGSFDIVSKNLNKLLCHNIHPLIMTVVSNNNVNGIVDLTKFLIEKDFNFRYSFVQFQQLNIQLVLDKMLECYDVLSSAIDKGYRFSERHRLCDLNFFSPTTQTCSNGLNGSAIYVNGDVYFCHTHFGEKQPIGSLFQEEDLISIIQNGTYYDKENVSSECQICKYRYICNSGCPIERIKGKDPHCFVYKQLIPVVYQLIGKEKLYNINH